MDKWVNQYRVVPVAGGFEAQMLYIIWGGRQEWLPLDAEGYWADPSAYSTGIITKHPIFESKTEAERAVALAASINGDHIRPVPDAQDTP